MNTKIIAIVVSVPALIVVFWINRVAVADLFWVDGPAPWEHVDGYFYPDKNDKSKKEIVRKIGGLQECKEWGEAKSNSIGDPLQVRSTYECGVGEFLEEAKEWGLDVHRLVIHCLPADQSPKRGAGGELWRCRN